MPLAAIANVLGLVVARHLANYQIKEMLAWARLFFTLSLLVVRRCFSESWRPGSCHEVTSKECPMMTICIRIKPNPAFFLCVMGTG